MPLLARAIRRPEHGELLAEHLKKPSGYRAPNVLPRLAAQKLGLAISK